MQPKALRGVEKKQGGNAIRNALPKLVLGSLVVSYSGIKYGLGGFIFIPPHCEILLVRGSNYLQTLILFAPNLAKREH